MIQIDSYQWLHWVNLYFWPLLRVLALIMTAPILSENTIPKRVKIGLGLLITVTIAPSLPLSDISIFSSRGVWVAVEQIMIGATLGFTMQLAFAAVRTTGEIIGLHMGISFATFFDPGSKLNMPVLARFLDMLFMLLFLAFNGHLWLLSILADTFHTLPIDGEGLSHNILMAITQAGGLIFLNGLMLALPIITLLLILNIALGLLNRMAPQLSIFVIGFPITLSVGILAITALLPLIIPFGEHLFGEFFSLITNVVSHKSLNSLTSR